MWNKMVEIIVWFRNIVMETMDSFRIAITTKILLKMLLLLLLIWVTCKRKRYTRLLLQRLLFILDVFLSVSSF